MTGITPICLTLPATVLSLLDQHVAAEGTSRSAVVADLIVKAPKPGKPKKNAPSFIDPACTHKNVQIISNGQARCICGAVRNPKGEWNLP